MQFFVVGVIILIVYVSSRVAAYAMITSIVVFSNVYGYFVLKAHFDKQQDLCVL